MKYLLIIEDDPFKATSLREFVALHRNFDQIFMASSLVEAIELVNERRYDLVLIDMAIPSHPTESGGGSPMSFLTGGLEVLFELNQLGRQDQCIIITQYDIEIAGQFYSVEDAERVISEELNCKLSACILYDEGNDYWKERLLRHI